MSDWEDDNVDQGAGNHRDYGNRDGGYNDRPPRREYRNEGGGGGGGGERSYEHMETIDIPSECIGLIIGRGGANIQRIQRDFNVRVDLDKNQGIAKISGNGRDNVNDAIENIKKQMDDKDGGRTSSYGRSENRYGSSGSGGGGGRDRSYEHMESIDIPSGCIGLIIGRGGANIQRIQKDFNVRVDLDKNQGIAKISGNNRDDVNDAIENITKQMDDKDGGSYGRSENR